MKCVPLASILKEERRGISMESFDGVRDAALSGVIELRPKGIRDDTVYKLFRNLRKLRRRVFRIYGFDTRLAKGK